MPYPDPIQWYHFQADLIWPGTVPLKMPEEVYVIYSYMFKPQYFLQIKGLENI